jgi:biopolymer transport protein ExbD
MNVWKMRYEGSPQSVDGLTAEQIVQGVQEGQWEPTDEVMGPNDTTWKSLEMHPHFAEAMAEFEPPASPPRPDETRLDMNPLIDVALVLLIFFILTTTYTEMRKMFPPPAAEQTEVKQTIGESQLRQFTIRLTATMENGAPVIRVENEVVPESELQAKLVYWKEKTGQSKLAVEMLDKNVPWKTFMAIQDAAAGAKISETIRIERPAAPLE